MNIPESKQVCDLELLGTTSVPYKPKGKIKPCQIIVDTKMT
jgi:hypothetical protein